jgi:hypothetical protein
VEFPKTAPGSIGEATRLQIAPASLGSASALARGPLSVNGSLHYNLYTKPARSCGLGGVESLSGILSSGVLPWVEQPPGPTEPEILAGLGTVVSRWSYVDGFMAEFLSFLLQANPALMYVLTADVSASTVSDWIRTLLRVRHIPNEPPEEIMSLLADIDRIRGQRNALVHGLWTRYVSGSAAVQTVKWDRSEVVKVELVTRADLDELVMDIAEVTRKLLGIAERYGHSRASRVVKGVHARP